jgi:MFS family permease
MAGLRDRLPAPVVAKYYLYRATVSFGFFAPVFTLFLLYRDLAYTEIALLSTQHAVLTAVGEVPTGYVGDRIGRRNSLLVSTAAMTLSIAGFVVASSLPAFAVLYGLWSLALVFRSGTGDAWLYETFREELDDEGRFTTVRGRADAVNRVVTVAAMLAGGALYAVRPELPFVASTVLHALGVPVLLSLPKTAAFADGGGGGVSVGATARVVHERLTVPGVRSVVAYAAVFFALVTVVDTYVQPIARDVVGVPESLLGLVYAAFTLGTAVAGYYAGTLDARLGTRRTTFAIPPVVTAVVGLAAVFPLLALPAFLLQKGANVALRSVVSGYLNDRAGDVGRATTLSAASMVYAAVRLPLILAIGVVADAYGPLFAVGTVAVLCLLGFGAVGAGRLALGRSGNPVAA